MQRYLFLLVLFFPFTNAQSCNEATDRWINDRCFKLVDQKLSNQNARDWCHNHQSYLATVPDSSTATFLATLTRVSFNIDSNFWIGLSRSSTNSPFKWDDGTPLVWTNFGPLRDGLFVAENMGNTKWQTVDGAELLNFVCSYTPGDTPKMMPTTTVPTTIKQTTARATTTAPKPSVTCLFMVDLQSSGIARDAITTYKSYYNFALLVASKLNDASYFTGYLDSFGYSQNFADHSTYPAYTYDSFEGIPFPIDGTDDDIDLDLKDVDATLTTATWEPPTKYSTCLILFSAAPDAEYDGTTLKTTYSSFATVIGVIIGNGATSIPGLTNPMFAASLSDSDAQAVVNKLLKSLP